MKLGGFGIKPDKLPRPENKEQHRGYPIAVFQDSFDRYLPPPLVTSGQVSHGPSLRGENAETDTETDAKSASVSANHEGETASETDVHLERGKGECPDCDQLLPLREPCIICDRKPLTSGEFLAEATRLFNGKPVTKEKQQ